MLSDLAAPLVAVLNLDDRSESSWLAAFHQACADCIVQIDNLRQSMSQVDREVGVCLDVIRNSLDWARSETCSVSEAQAMLQRVLQILESIAETV